MHAPQLIGIFIIAYSILYCMCQNLLNVYINLETCMGIFNLGPCRDFLCKNFPQPKMYDTIV